MISFRLKKEEEKFLKQYVNEKSLNLSMFIKNAIFEKIEEIEDYKIAEKIHNDIKLGKETKQSFDSFLSEMEISNDI